MGVKELKSKRKYKLEVSADLGNTYKVMKESDNLDSFTEKCLWLDKKLLRWVIKDENNKIVKSCAIHNEIKDALGIKDKMLKEKCGYCKGDKTIRNPTGKCDHLYYPENVNKNLKPQDIKPTKQAMFLMRYLKFKDGCIGADIIDIDEIIKLFGVWINS